ncbi:MAG TPA: VOC family protein [Terriglobia bacterium]
MAKRATIDQLDAAVEAMLTRHEPAAASTPGDSALTELVRLAAGLSNLPPEDFRTYLKSELERRARMGSTAKPAPDPRPEATRVRPVPEGYHTATPYLTVRGAADAIEFYKKAFGATEVMRLAQPDGKIGHAEIKIGDSHIMLSDEFPDYGSLAPQLTGGSPVTIHLYVEDVDTRAREAIAAGAKVLRPVQDQFYGDRAGKLADPFGHTWFVSTHIEDVPPEEIERRAKAFMQQQGASAAQSSAPKQEPAASGATSPGAREGYNAVTPYVTVQRAVELLDFVKEAFGATEIYRGIGGSGGLHAEVRIGDSIVMMGGSPGMSFPEKPAVLHLYVNDADAVYQRALEAGATSTHAPVDQDYGDREAGVKDPFGNQWYIATNKATGHVREGLRSVTPYFIPHGASEMIDFLKQAFGAEEVARYADAEGTLQHAAIRIGDSMVEMGEAHGPYQPVPMAIYLYVADVDATYDRALRAGATSITPPADQPYGDRNAGVQDRFGHTWYIATHIRA